MQEKEQDTVQDGGDGGMIIAVDFDGTLCANGEQNGTGRRNVLRFLCRNEKISHQNAGKVQNGAEICRTEGAERAAERA